MFQIFIRDVQVPGRDAGGCVGLGLRRLCDGDAARLAAVHAQVRHRRLTHHRLALL